MYYYKTLIFPKTSRFLLSLLLSVGLLGCNPLTYLSLAFPPSATVNQLQQKTGGTVIYIRGIVRDKAPFLDKGAYQLEDETGKVWVISESPLPKSGEPVTIKGQVEYQSIPVGGQELGEFYLVELEKVANLPEGEPTPTVSPQTPINPSTEIKIEPVVPPTPSPKPSVLPNDLFFPHKQNAK